MNFSPILFFSLSTKILHKQEAWPPLGVSAGGGACLCFGLGGGGGGGRLLYRSPIVDKHTPMWTHTLLKTLPSLAVGNK